MGKQNSVMILTDEDKKLVKLWNEGFTGQMLADYFGRTRNAIMGRIMRLRDAGHEVINKDPNKVKQNNKKKQTKTATYYERPQSHRIQRVIIGIDELTKKQLKSAKYDDNVDRLKNFEMCKNTRVRIHNLKSTHCRYVVDNRFPAKAWYCGHPIERGSYCSHHAQLCYMPMEKKQVADRIARSSVAYGRSSR
jgi:GcrA cell cycle regulator